MFNINLHTSSVDFTNTRVAYMYMHISSVFEISISECKNYLYVIYWWAQSCASRPDYVAMEVVPCLGFAYSIKNGFIWKYFSHWLQLLASDIFNLEIHVYVYSTERQLFFSTFHFHLILISCGKECKHCLSTSFLCIFMSQSPSPIIVKL